MRHTWAIVGAIAIVALLILAANIPPHRQGNGPTTFRFLVGYATPYNQSDVNSYINSVYSEATNASAHVSAWISQTCIDTDMWSIYTTVNSSSTFQSLVSTWGSLNATLEVQYGNQTGIQNATFAVAWSAISGAVNTSYETVWTGDIGSGAAPAQGPLAPCPGVSQVLGPVSWSSPVTYRGTQQQTLYAGWDWYPLGHTISQSYFVSNVPNLQYPSTSIKKNIPQGTQIDASTSQWDGVCDAFICGHSIVQTGWAEDVNNPTLPHNWYTPYVAWWEVFGTSHGTSASPPYAAISPLYGLTLLSTAPGDHVYEGLNMLSSGSWGELWWLGFYDPSIGGAATTWISGAAFTPKWSDSYLEMNSICGCSNGYGPVPAQLPQFESYQADWYQGLITRASGTFWPVNLYPQGQYDVYPLGQYSSSTQNTGESYSQLSNIVTMTWANSNYDWNHV